MIEDFQQREDAKIMILSLKAGGSGLNLVQASNVIHYDLWWNPAVESQATDRAYRIGQQNRVMVHRLITLNTFEEKIDAMIQAKKKLADMAMATGETWLSEASDTELRDLFSLSL
jgi:SNF2 family DNA or RNA helicase